LDGNQCHVSSLYMPETGSCNQKRGFIQTRIGTTR
jgi:hypothetical protein